MSKPKPKFVCIGTFIKGAVIFIGNLEYEITHHKIIKKTRQIQIKAKPIKKESGCCILKEKSICLWIRKSKERLGDNLYEIVQSAGL